MLWRLQLSARFVVQVNTAKDPVQQSPQDSAHLGIFAQRVLKRALDLRTAVYARLDVTVKMERQYQQVVHVGHFPILRAMTRKWIVYRAVMAIIAPKLI
jgi:hypothetical protein